MKLRVMYKIIILQEMVYTELSFFSIRLTENQLILIYYFMLDGQSGSGRAGTEIGYSCSQCCSYILLL